MYILWSFECVIAFVSSELSLFLSRTTLFFLVSQTQTQDTTRSCFSVLRSTLLVFSDRPQQHHGNGTVPSELSRFACLFRRQHTFSPRQRRVPSVLSLFAFRFLDGTFGFTKPHKRTTSQQQWHKKRATIH